MKVFGIALTSFALGLAGLFTVTASEARDAGAFGGGGGGAYRSQCPANMAWVGYIGNSGSALDGIRALCTTVQADKTTAGTVETDYHGGSGGDRIQRMCTNGVVTALQVSVDQHNMVQQIDLHCTHLPTSQMTVELGRSHVAPSQQGGFIKCNADEIGVGIYGRSGVMIDQIGLICEKLTVVQPALAVALPPPLHTANTNGNGGDSTPSTTETGVNRPGNDYQNFDLEPTIAGFGPCKSVCEVRRQLQGLDLRQSGRSGSESKMLAEVGCAPANAGRVLCLGCESGNNSRTTGEAYQAYR